MVLIINADDFGKDARTNQAIVQSFKKGLCSSTTIMANMPGFEEACQLSRDNNLQRHVGIHLVLTGGYPLTEKIKYLPKFCNQEGQLSFSPDSFFIALQSQEKRALADEIRAQIRQCRKRGVPLTHLDAHHNLHTIWGVASVLIPIAKQEHIPYIRIKANCDLELIPLRFKAYTYIFNYRLKAKGLAGTKYFGSINQFLLLKKRLGSLEAVNSFEVSIHPAINDRQELVSLIFDKEVDLETEVKEIDCYQESVSFAGARYC